MIHSFFLIYDFIFSKFLTNSKIELTEPLISLNNISEKIEYYSNEETNYGFWDIIEINELDKDFLNILSSDNGFKKSFPINGIFNKLNNNNLFCLNYEIKYFCRFCKVEKNEKIYSSH